MSERKPIRREEREERRKTVQSASSNRKRPISANNDENRKKRKPMSSDAGPSTEGRPKKPSDHRRPPSRKEAGVGTRRDSEMRPSQRQRVSPNEMPRNQKPRRPASSLSSNKRRASQRPSPPPSTTKKVLMMVWDVVFYAALGILLLGVIMFNFNDNPNKSLFGYRIMTVLTNSMAPNKNAPEFKDGFKSGALIVVAHTNPEEIKEGDIITFNPVVDDTNTYLTHRVKKVMTELAGEEGLFFQTKGDANTGDDIPILATQVVGKVVFSVPNVGNIMKFLRDNIVIVAIFATSIFAFFMVLKYYLGMEESKAPARRKKRAAY